jgi:hypothetical protein
MIHADKTTRKLLGFTLGAALIAVLAGCTHSPAERAFMQRHAEAAMVAEARGPHSLGAGSAVAAGHSLGSGDMLGMALFEDRQTGGSDLALFRQAQTAYQIAEAHEANGTYDAWYASLEPVDADTAIAQTEDEDKADDTFVTVPVPEPAE